jgi:predicted  nucleic acid-binding Zn-ribbon protein
MPHQCLKCGSVFDEGSPQLLRGCPKCNGNRFFYTKIPLDDSERDKIRKQMGKDIKDQLADFLGKQDSDLVDNAGNWITMKPKDLRKAFKDHLPEKKSLEFKSKSEMDLIENETYRKHKIKEAIKTNEKTKTPETIGINPPGKYDIDIKALLEHEPIIIQKDGSYTIHLPSVFKMHQSKKEKK